MTIHLRPEEIDAAIAGLDLDDEAKQHLENCVLCRAEVAEFDELIEARQAELDDDEPDWNLQVGAIMDRLPVEGGSTGQYRSGWRRPVLAVAAVVVMAVGIGVLRWDRSIEPPVDEMAVDEILAEMDELLSDDSIPGFEIIDPRITDLSDILEQLEPAQNGSVG